MKINTASNLEVYVPETQEELLELLKAIRREFAHLNTLLDAVLDKAATL